MGQTITKTKEEEKRKPRLLGIDVGQRFLNEAEKIDKYRTTCGNSWPNKIARLNQTYKVIDVGKTQNIGDELKVLEYVPKWISQKTDVVFLHETADGGMPHTRPGLICIPNGINNPNIKSTIIHEAVHISQRENIELWDTVYEKAWNIKKWTSSVPFELEVHRRYNPDTFMSRNYIWKDKWIIVPIYKNKNEPELGRIKLVFYNVENEEWLSFVPEEWEKFVGKNVDVAEQEHPHEMAAYIIQRFFEGNVLTKEYEKRLLQCINVYFPQMGINYVK